jgi:protein-tyrosine phosphatase
MEPFWIDTGNELRLAIVPRPRGGDWLEDELIAMKNAGVDIVVSMLRAEEEGELGLVTEADACRAAGLEFKSFPIQDRDVPTSRASFAAFVGQLRTHLHYGRSLAVHCRASIGRSSLLLAGILCAEGFSPEDAFKLLAKARGLQVPDTPEQVRWIESFAANLDCA